MKAEKKVIREEKLWEYEEMDIIQLETFVSKTQPTTLYFQGVGRGSRTL